ncbi:MAG: metallophosphoesterase family protein [Rhizomicrobium sp.]
MLWGFLSDAHGNVGAFRKAMALLREHGAEKIFFLGDAVGYFAGTEVIEELMGAQRPDVAIMGNHDHMLLAGDVSEARERIYRLERVRQRLSSEQRRFLENCPQRWETSINGRRIVLVHGSPHDELNGYLYPDTPLAPLSEDEPFVVFIGQTHRPFIRRVGLTTYVNVGSCGLPRDNGGLGAIALYDTTSHDIRVLRFPIQSESESALLQGDVADEVRQVLRRREEVSEEIHVQ